MRIAVTTILAVLALTPAQVLAQGLTRTPARAADVASIDAIVAAFYDVISVPEGGTPDWSRDSTLYAADVRFTIIGRTAAGRPEGRRIDHGTYARESDAFLRRGFIEREVHRETHRYGPMAQVFSTYEWRRSAAGPVGGRGINSLQLFHDGARWWIVSAMWLAETSDNPIPQRFLPGGS